MLTDTQLGIMQVLFKKSCIPVQKKSHLHGKRGVGRAITHHFVLQGGETKHCCLDENDGRSCLEGKGLKVKLTNLLADLFEDEVI